MSKHTPRGYKVGTRAYPPANATGVGDPPWWASTDPKVWESQRACVRARGARIKTPGEHRILEMESVFFRATATA